jgi:hypothetical protein
MAVDGGVGNAISFSELQTYYGGSNPISMSEYYRGGSEVPSTRTDTTTNTGVTALVNQSALFGTAGSGVDGNQSRLTIDGANNTGVNSSPATGTIVFSESTTVSATKDYSMNSLLEYHLNSYNNTFYTSTSAHLRLGGYDFFDASNCVRSITTSSSFVTAQTLTSALTAGTCGIEIYYVASSSDAEGSVQPIVTIKRGGTTLYSFNVSFSNGSAITSSANLTGLQNGDTIEARTGSYGGQTRVVFFPREAVGGNANNTFAAGSYALSFYGLGGNNNLPGLDATLNFSTSGTVQYNSFGGTFTSISTTNTDVTVNTNTNVPTSGPVNMNVFNAPGTPSP